MTESKVDITSEEAAALLTCLEYYILFDLQARDKYQKGQIQNYEPIPVKMVQTLNDLRPKLLEAAKGPK